MKNSIIEFKYRNKDYFLMEIGDDYVESKVKGNTCYLTEGTDIDNLVDTKITIPFEAKRIEKFWGLNSNHNINKGLVKKIISLREEEKAFLLFYS